MRSIRTRPRGPRLINHHDLVIRPPALGDLARAAALTLNHLTPTRTTTAQLRDLERDGVVLVATSGAHLVGATAGIALAVAPTALGGAHLPGDNVGVIRFVAVDPSWRDRRVGSRLLAGVTEALRDRGHDVLAAVVPGGFGIPLLSAHGWQRHTITPYGPVFVTRA